MFSFQDVRRSYLVSVLVKAGKAGVDGGQILLYLLFGEKNDFREMIPESILGGEGDRKF